MRAKDIVLGKFYRLRECPTYGYVKPIKILKPKQSPNTNRYTVVECEHTVYKDDATALIRYLKPDRLLKEV